LFPSTREDVQCIEDNADERSSIELIQCVKTELCNIKYLKVGNGNS
jgi:hypothetical protein